MKLGVNSIQMVFMVMMAMLVMMEVSFLVAFAQSRTGHIDCQLLQPGWSSYVQSKLTIYPLTSNLRRFFERRHLPLH